MSERLRSAVLWVATAPIRIYRTLLSPALPARCKYEPSCSAYALSALRTYGVVRGSILAAWRLLRCNPLSHGGYDPVEAQGLFRPRRTPAGGSAEGSSTGADHGHRGALI